MILNPDCKFWECYNSELPDIVSVVSLAVKSGHHKVGDSHCQEGQGGSKFLLRILTVGNEKKQVMTYISNSILEKEDEEETDDKIFLFVLTNKVVLKKYIQRNIIYALNM